MKRDQWNPFGCVIQPQYNGDTLIRVTMPKTEYITARVEPQLKENAEAILRQLGMSTTGAITMFLQQVVLHEGLPFEVRVPSERGSLVGAGQSRGASRDTRNQKLPRV